MDIKQLVQSLTHDTWLSLRQAVETGKWPDGTKLTEEQRENTMQLVIAYQSQVLKSKEHFTVGEDGNLIHKSKSELKRQFKQEEDIARFNQDDI